MGMDVFGIKPTSEKGKYFRNNIWYWRPLWNYCCLVDSTLVDKVPEGYSNTGDGLKTAAEARQLAFKLQHKIDTGKAKEYVDEYETERKNLPKEDCKYCDEFGEREWQQQNGQPYKKTCNACQGTKKVDSWESYYPMTLENIQEFIYFLMDCGGFQIC